MESHVSTIYRIDGGILRGTEIEAVMGFVLVRYPHRKGKDCYIPPMKSETKEVKTWHCCQEPCAKPDFEGGIEALIDHLMQHKGRLLRPWSKRLQLKQPIPAVRIPANEWGSKPTGGINEERRFCVKLYIESLKRLLHSQGIEVVDGTK